MRTALLRAGLFILAPGLLLLASCEPLRPFVSSTCDEPDCRSHAKVCKTPSMMALARDLDHLEHYIDAHGSVVAKQPDIWGQARMTRHREEFEEQMASELDDFKVTLQGALARSDQAYFANATALNAAISGRSAGLFAPRPRVVVNTATAQGTSLEQPTGTVAVPTAATIPADAFKAFENLKRTDPTLAAVVGFTDYKSRGITLEPTVYLDQKARYLNHLNELRRINEGDDTADSPGYALNLVRVPVSVLPGKKTATGHGAEVTMTLTPHLGDELLPATFRNLVTNDLIDQLAMTVAQLLNDVEYGVKGLTEEEYVQWTYYVKGITPEAKDGAEPVKPIFQLEASFAELLAAAPSTLSKSRQQLQAALQKAVEPDKMYTEAFAKLAAKVGRKARTSVSKLRRSPLPFAPSQVPDVYSLELAEFVVRELYKVFEVDPASNHPCKPGETFVHLPAVQSYLQEEIASAYRFLANPVGAPLWEFCTPHLAHLVRTQNTAELHQLRHQFFALADKLSGPPALGPKDKTPALPTYKLTVALAWAVLVDSALLNEQLIRDMRETASNKGCGCAGADPLPYFLPNPPAEARQAFNEYVRCRWPIHVFALDPVAQQQNIASSFSARREMQLSLALAFASGQISAQNMMRYARRIELEMETIELNQTAVGFSHGNDTFGWRFYPRYQTADIESNATVFARDLMLGGPSKDALTKQRKLEPGMRECVAVIIMPSFVPQATLHVSSGWFKLTNPRHKVLSNADALRMSRAVKSIQTCSTAIPDADCYRDGDLGRLMVKAQQLEARLPLQTMSVQVPFENTLGGFGLFNNGVTDLAPELYGWYGAARVQLDAPTTVFLMGNHYSVHQTRVIVGGKAIPRGDLTMLSRQVMQVTIPRGALTHLDRDRQYVDVHIATPYGVTAPLLIPVCPPPGKAPGAAVGAVWTTTTFELAYAYSGVGIKTSGDPAFRPKDLALKPAGPVAPGINKASVTLSFAAPYAGVPGIALTDLDIKQGQIVVPGDKLAAAIFARFGDHFGPEATRPPVNLTIDGAAVQLIDVNGQPVAGGGAAANALTVAWIKAP